ATRDQKRVEETSAAHDGEPRVGQQPACFRLTIPAPVIEGGIVCAVEPGPGRYGHDYASPARQVVADQRGEEGSVVVHVLEHVEEEEEVEPRVGPARGEPERVTTAGGTFGDLGRAVSRIPARHLRPDGHRLKQLGGEPRVAGAGVENPGGASEKTGVGE